MRKMNTIFGDSLHEVFEISYATLLTEFKSAVYSFLDGSVHFQLKAAALKSRTRTDHGTLKRTEKAYFFVKFSKSANDQSQYTIKLSSSSFDINNKIFITDNNDWRLLDVKTLPSLTYCCDVAIHVTRNTVPKGNTFASLYEDTTLTDFGLKGDDGTVHVHKVALAATSPVLKNMLSGPWKESEEGEVSIPGISKTTLQNLKEYIYLNTLPDAGLEQLLLLASCYMIKDLEIRCIEKLIQGLTSTNVYQVLEFAINHKIHKLFLETLYCIQTGVVKVDDIKKELLRLGNI